VKKKTQAQNVQATISDVSWLLLGFSVVILSLVFIVCGWFACLVDFDSWHFNRVVVLRMGMGMWLCFWIPFSNYYWYSCFSISQTLLLLFAIFDITLLLLIWNITAANLKEFSNGLFYQHPTTIPIFVIHCHKRTYTHGHTHTHREILLLRLCVCWYYGKQRKRHNIRK